MQTLPPILGKFRLGELVKKNETSATTLRKRVRFASKKIKNITKEHRRIASDKGLYAVAVTLTFANDANFCPKHISRFIACLRAKLKRKGHSLLYVWVLERASAIHYHLALWLPRGYTLDHSELLKWWPWGSTWTQACRKVSAWIRYISKREDKTNLPIAARMFGSGGLDESGKVAVVKAMLPRWLAVLLPTDAAPCRLAGMGWIDKKTGEVYASPWMWTPHGAVLRPTDEKYL